MFVKLAPPAVLRTLFTLLGLLSLLSSTRLTAQDEPPPAKWAVVRVDEEVRVIPSADVKALRKDLEAKWKEEQKQHEEARKAAKKNKQEFTAEKPTKPAFKILKDGFKTQEGAEAFQRQVAEEAAAGDGKARNSKSAAGKDEFLVVRVGEEHRVVEASALKQLKADTAEADKRALSTWQAAKKDAGKSGTPFDQKKPGKTAVAVVKKADSRAEAEAMMAKLKAQDGD